MRKIKSALAVMMAAGMMSPQTVNNPVTGQTMQQQMIAQEKRNKKRFGQRKSRIKSNGRVGRPYIVHNQRQKRKRWRQSSWLRAKQTKR